ncbi:MAG: 6-bladed beta-propeller, partial [Phycisphaerae bacterium]|nr:6-bladed beta-propeller [Phycisphaerae bacterium]
MLASFALVASGCNPSLKPIFEPLDPALVWPPPPGEPRIRYVGQLQSSADLKPPPQFFRVLGDLFVGAAKPDTLYGPRSVVCTPDGNRVWVADPGGRCLHLFNLHDRSYRKITRLAGGPLLSPMGLCLGPAGSIFLCDSENVAIYRLSSCNGALLESFRLPEDIDRPVALSYDPDNAELFVVDVAAHDVKVLGPDGGLRRIIGRRGTGAGEFNFPCNIAADGELIWIVDTGNSRVQGLRRTGEPVASFGQIGDAPGDLALPKAAAFDGDGNLYVVDARFENVQIFDRQGQLLLFFGQEGTGPGEFWLPGDIFIDNNNRIWICDTYNCRLQVFECGERQEARGKRQEARGKRQEGRG